MPLRDTSPTGSLNLAAANLGCQRGRRWLFQKLEFTLAPGRVTWLRGANGSGKTSLLRLLAGLSEPSSGQATLGGVDVRRLDDESRQRLSFIGHQNALKDGLSLGEAVAFLASLSGLDDPAGRAQRALDRLGLGRQSRTAVRHLSQGMRRRGALARVALDEQPRVWLLDEPLDALDTASIDRFAELVQDKVGAGSAVLLTSHQAVPWSDAIELPLDRWSVAA